MSREVDADSADRALADVQDVQRRPRARDIAHAGARGAVAAMAMTAVRAVTGGLGVVHRTPPQLMLREAAPKLLLRKVPRRHRDEVIELAHWTYGAVGGMVYGALPARWRRPPWSALAYGLVVWGGFETTLAPTLGLNRKRGSGGLAAERVALAVDHLLYGLVLSEIRPAHKAMR